MSTHGIEIKTYGRIWNILRGVNAVLFLDMGKATQRNKLAREFSERLYEISGRQKTYKKRDIICVMIDIRKGYKALFERRWSGLVPYTCTTLPYMYNSAGHLY